MPFVNHVEFEVTDLKHAAKFYRALLGFRVRILPNNQLCIMESGSCTERRILQSQTGQTWRHVGRLPGQRYRPVSEESEEARRTGLPEEKRPAGDMGYYGALRDPFGNIVGLWSSH